MTEIEPAPTRPPTIVFWALGAAITLVLAIAYWSLVRTTYQPILTNVEPQDAAEIVKTLDEQKVPYQLADDGRTILVDSSVADKARIELIGSDLPLHGQVGFELFNKSDMGLTEFDQKINYQRALQGELARTILMLDGIKAVRIHLGLADQGLFRSDQQRPKASVTVILKPGTALTEQRVEGIQRLVAGAVPDMATDAVAVLDGTGRIISGADEPTQPAMTVGDRTLETFRTQIDQAIHSAYPELQFALNVSFKAAHTAIPASPSDAAAPAVTISGTPDAGYNVRLTTSQLLDPAVRAGLTRVVADKGFDAARGDTLVFLVGPVILPPDRMPISAASDKVVSRSAPLAPRSNRTALLDYWPWALAGAIVLLVLAFISDRMRSRSAGSLANFAHELRTRLDAEEGAA